MSDLFVGLDVGGTRTRLLARSADTENDVSLFGPAGNFFRAGPDGTATVLSTLIGRALELRPQCRLRAVCAGVAGAGSQQARDTLAQSVRSRLAACAPFALQITHDGAVALEAAFGEGSGMIIIAGTGSSLFGRALTGNILRAGGWGFMLGDEGSGHAIGLKGLRAVGHACDGGPATILTDLLMTRHGIAGQDALLHRVYRESWPVQQMAPLVLQAVADGDAEARRILYEETRALATQALWLARRSGPMDERVSLFGGLSKSMPYMEGMRSALREALPGWSLHPAQMSGVEAAVRLAQALAREQDVPPS